MAWYSKGPKHPPIEWRPKALWWNGMVGSMDVLTKHHMTFKETKTGRRRTEEKKFITQKSA